MEAKNNRLSFKDKCIYSSASIGDAVGYMLVTTFLLFFLTTVAGIQPAIAGTLTAIGSVWDSINNLVIGYISDHTSCRIGRRRIFMFIACIPLMLAMSLLFTAVEFSETVKVIYYGLMILAFWSSFTTFFIPYYAMGAEYTTDYDERTSLRSFTSFFNMIGTIFAMAMPTYMVERLCESGMTVQRAWQLTAVILGIITSASIFITALNSKGKDSTEAAESDGEPGKKSLVGMFSDYFQVLKLAPMRWLIVVSVFFLIAYIMTVSDLVYLLTYELGLSGKGVSAGLLSRSFMAVIIIPIIAKLCIKTDKRSTQMGIIVFGIIGLVAMRFLPIDNIVVLAILIFIVATTTQSYWQIMPAVFYDVCEYDEYTTGKRREGAIVSVQGLVEAISAGIGAQILGLILQAAGFDGTAAVQTETALVWIYNCETWVPALFLLVALFALYKFPITKEYYRNIVRELEKRKG